MNFFFPRLRGPLHGREHVAHAAQHPHPPRRAGARREQLGRLSHRDDRPLGRRARRGVRVAPLADVGPRACRRVPRDAARHVPVPARPDAAADESGASGAEIAEQLELPPALEAAVVHPRLLRLGQPQREGGLPAVPRLVRRQPGAPLDASARGGGAALRRRDGRRRRVVAVAQRAFDDGDYRWATRCSTTCLRRRAPCRGPRRSRPTRSSSSGSDPRTAPGATCTCRGPRAAARFVRHPHRQPRDRHRRRAVAWSRCSVRSRSGIDGPKAWHQHLVISWVVSDLDEVHG